MSSLKQNIVNLCSACVSPELRRVCWHPGSVRSYDSPCYITLHVALPPERKGGVGRGAALKPEPPVNCIMWTRWLKLAAVNTCTLWVAVFCEDALREWGGPSERYHVTNCAWPFVCVWVWSRCFKTASVLSLWSQGDAVGPVLREAEQWVWGFVTVVGQPGVCCCQRIPANDQVQAVSCLYN